MINMKKLMLAATGAAVLAMAVAPTQAMAWRGGYHHHHGGGAWPFALVGGLAAGALIAGAANDRDRYYDRPVAYAPPPPAYYAPSQPCRQVNRTDDVEGYAVRMAATMCYDSYGRAYIVRGSEHPVDDGYDD